MIETIVQIALDCGAKGAQYLPASAIITDPVFRRICEGNACGKFGRCYMCPPDIGPVEELMAQLALYPHAVLYQSIGTIEDSFDFEGMTEVSNRHANLSQRIREATPAGQRVLHLTCGGCHVCKRCAKLDNEPCRFPDRALASVESYGVDVYNTTKDTELKYINGVNTVTYFGLLLFEEE